MTNKTHSRQQVVRGDPNITMTVITQTLKSLQAHFHKLGLPFPKKLTIQADNCASENKVRMRLGGGRDGARVSVYRGVIQAEPWNAYL